MKKKTITMVAALTLAIGCTVGAAVAWLTDATDPVKNTFTVGNIDITLAETTEDFKMVPGSAIEKDPVVTVEANSESCWLFVKVEESANLQEFIDYTIANGWTQLSTDSNVYYREVSASTGNQEFPVLTDNRVTVQNTVTKEMMDGLTTDGNYPTLTFTAYACQRDNIASAETAWAELQK